MPSSESKSPLSPHYDLYGIGAAIVDTEIAVSEEDLKSIGVAKGVMTLVDEERQSRLLNDLIGQIADAQRASGGSAANSVIAASYFGAKSFYSCRVADDNDGRFYLQDMKDAGVSVPANAAVSSGITGKCLVMITPDAERTMNTFLGVSETIDSGCIDEDALKSSAFAYIEGYLVTSNTGKPAAVALRKLAEKHGVKVAMSLSDPAIVEYFHSGLQEMLGEGVDLLFCNEAEAIAYTKTNNLAEAFESLKQYAKKFAITQGAKGALMFDGDKQIHVDSPEVHALDTNGAGDMFAGAFICALQKGLKFEAAGEFSCTAAAKVVSQFGPRLKTEQYADLEALLNK